MTNKTTTHTMNAVASVLISGIFATTGCTLGEGDDLGQTAGNVIYLNGFYFQNFGMNPTDENGLAVGSGTPIYQVSLDGLEVNGDFGNALKVSGQDLTAQQEVDVDKLFHYLAGCALSSSQSISLTMSNSTVNTYTGDLGLATEWATGALYSSSQPKITACLAALTNSDNQHVKVSLRSDDIATSATEKAAFGAIEGAFWGNAFGEEPALYTCSADISGIAGRSCTGEENDCGFTNVGICSEICTQDTSDGHYTSCLGSDDVITVMLPYTKKTAFAGDHSCTANITGTLSCWGDNDKGQVGDGTNTYRFLPVGISLVSSISVVEVAGGENHSCARQATGMVTCWGDNTSGQLGAGSSANSISDPTQVTSLIDDAMSIVSGANHSCALTADSTVLCWGENSAGQLGDTTTTDSNVPAVTDSNNDFIRLASSSTSDHSCAIDEDGAVYCWGANQSGQLGDATTTDRTSPVLAQNIPSEIVDICTGTSYTCVLGANGNGTCFGSISDSTTQTANSITCSATSACFGGPNGDECF